MKNTMRLLLVVLLMLATPASAQFGGLKGLAKGVKQKATQTAKTTTVTTRTQPEEVTRGHVQLRGGEQEAEAEQTTTTTQRAVAPWPMCGGLYKDKTPREFLYNIIDVSDAELVAIRDKCFARYKNNVPIVTNWGPNADIAEQENQNFMHLLYEMRTILGINLSNVNVSYNGTIEATDAYYLITNRNGGGIGCFAKEKGGKFQFVMKDGSGTFLNAEEMATAKDAALRMRKFQQLTYGLNDVLKVDQNNYDVNLGMMYNLSGMYANAVEKACEENKPENIERKPRPAAGALHASMKAQALAVAKADDPDVVDVIITSGQWDVKMKGVIPVNRNIYGYYIYKDEYGLQCYSRMWSEDYIGNGNYGKLRKGGVGVGSPFYIKE